MKLHLLKKRELSIVLLNAILFFFTFLLTGLIGNRLYAQAANTYSFSTSTGAALDPMLGATTISPADRDDGVSAVQSIGFSFVFEGTTYTQYSASVDGFIRLGGTQASSQYINAIANTTNIPKLFPYWDDLALGSNGTIRTALAGTSPNQIRIIEWFGTVPRSTTGTANSTFQLLIYETTNQIEFRYGSMLGPTASASVGIRGSVPTPASFHSVTVAANTTSTATANNTNTAVPSSGRTYTFTPPIQAPPAVTTGTKSNVTSSSATLAGTIAPNSFPVVTSSGIVVGTSPSPVIGGAGVIDSTTNPVVTSGTFTRNFVGLSTGTTYYYRAYAINASGTSYGPDSIFTTNSSASIPSINRIAATLVQGFTSNIGGAIVNDGGATITASGAVFRTSGVPVLGGPGVVDSTTNPVITSGSFTFNLAGLIPNTKYYFRAYATNIIGTAYSSLDSFTTQPVIASFPYAQNFDTVNIVTGWSTVIVTGTVNDWQLGPPAKTFLNGAASAPNAFVTRLTGNYVGSDCAVLSPQFNFTGVTATPVLRFKQKFDTDADADWDGGIVEISINNGTWTRVDSVVGAGANFNTVNSTAWYNNNVASGPVSAPKFSGLSTAYATHSNGWITSSTPLTGVTGQSNVRVRFRFGADAFGIDEGWAIDDIEVILPVAPTVLTTTRTNITTSNATLGGDITNNGANTVTASGIVLSISPNPVRGAIGVVDSATSPVVGLGTFSVNVTGLSPATTYYYRAYAVNQVGTSYGVDSSFITPASAVIPTVNRIVASNVQTTAATVGGNITNNGGNPVFLSGVVISTNRNPVIGGVGVIDSVTNPTVPLGTFNFNLAGLSHSTKYFYRAYAINGVGTAYSTQDSFTTLPIISILPYTENFDGATTLWVASAINTATNAWVRGTPAKTFINGAFSPPNAFVTTLTGNYLGTEDCVVLSPQFDFTSFSADPVLRFRHKMDVDADIGYDGGVVEISINGGAWTRLNSAVGTGTNYNTPTSFSWYNDASAFYTLGANMFSMISTSYSSNTNGWIESATILTGAAGQSNVRVRFRFAADGVTDEGWAIDNVEVVNIVTPTTPASNVTITPANTSATVNFTSGNGQGRLVVARLTTTTAVAPTNNTLYTANTAFGSGSTTGTGNFVVFVGNGTSVNVTGLTQLTGYTFDVYEYNGRYMHNAFASAATNATTTLPVQLIDFKAKANELDVVLNWVTAAEINNKGFEIERSTNGDRFELIGFSKGAGNTNSVVNYQYIDEDAFSMTNSSNLYYRLRQVDFDGAFEYSPTVLVKKHTTIFDGNVSAQPVPFNSNLQINVNLNGPSALQISLTDITGKIVRQMSYSGKDGSNLINFNDLANFSSGIYMIRVSGAEQTQVIKVIKE